MRGRLPPHLAIPRPHLEPAAGVLQLGGCWRLAAPVVAAAAVALAA